MGNLLFRIRNSLSSTNLILLCIGVGVAMIGSFAQAGWEIPQEFARALTYFGIALIILGIVLAIWRFFKNPIEKKNRIYSIISILDSIEKHLWQLAGKQKGEDVAWQRYKETNYKIIQLVGIAVPEGSSADEAKEKVAGLKSELEEKIFIKGQPLSKKVEIVRAISRLLDSDGFGLKEQRSSSKPYLRLNKLVDEYYNDYKDIMNRDLDILIKAHKDLAEAGANIFLVKKRFLYLRKLTNEITDIINLFSPSMQAAIEGLEGDTEDTLRYIRLEISQHIREIK